MTRKHWYEHVKPYLKDLFLRKILQANLSPQAVKLLLILKGHKNSSTLLCNPSQALLGQEMNKSIRSIQRYIKELIESGIIAVEHMGKMITNKYYILIDDDLEVFKQQYEESKEVETKIKNKCNYYKNKSKKTDGWNWDSNYTKYNNMEEIEKRLLGWT